MAAGCRRGEESITKRRPGISKEVVDLHCPQTRVLRMNCNTTPYKYTQHVYTQAVLIQRSTFTCIALIEWMCPTVRSSLTGCKQGSSEEVMDAYSLNTTKYPECSSPMPRSGETRLSVPMAGRDDNNNGRIQSICHDIGKRGNEARHRTSNTKC